MCAWAVHVPAPPHVAPDHDRAQEDQQSRHDQLGGGPEPCGQPHAQDDDEQRDDADRRGVPQTPDESQPGGAPQAPGARPCRQGGDGRKMVWLKGMPQAQESADGQDGYNGRRHVEAQI